MAKEKQTQNKFRDKAIPAKKTNAVKELSKLVKSSSCILLASIKNMPSRQFQIIKKNLRGKAVIKVPKKRIAVKALEDAKKGKSIELKGYLKEDTAIIFSELGTFQLSALLTKNKSKAKAKVGQIVNDEVTIEPGPTELVPGPVISQLSGLGLKFAIADGKIEIKEAKTILKAGDKVSDAAADIMSKLDIKPVSIGFEPMVAYDANDDKIYVDIKIDNEKALEEFKLAYSRAIGLAVNRAYPTKETIPFILGKAQSQENALSKLIKDDIQGGQ